MIYTVNTGSIKMLCMSVNQKKKQMKSSGNDINTLKIIEDIKNCETNNVLI